MAITQSPPDYVVAFRKFLREPEKACSEQLKCKLENLQEYIGSHIYFNVTPPFDPEACRPDEVSPYIWYSLIGTRTTPTLNCSTANPDRITFSLEIYDCDPLRLFCIDQCLREIVADYQGPFGDIYVQDIQLGSQSSDYVLAGTPATRKLNWNVKIWTFTIWTLFCGCTTNKKMKFFDDDETDDQETAP